MKTYLDSKTENKTQVKLKKIEGKIDNLSNLSKYMEFSINQLFEDKNLYLKQKPYVLKTILKELKANDMVDEKLIYTTNLLIRNVNSFIKVLKEEVKAEDGKVTNYIPSTQYKSILEGLIMFTLNSSLNKIIRTTLRTSKA